VLLDCLRNVGTKDNQGDKMATRRMFSIKIINTAKFLKLPVEAQNLYFHLIIRADDDGIVEAFPILKTLGSSEESLILLHKKELIRVLNEDLIIYITDWLEHNNIRADRKIDSRYKDLLIQTIPYVRLLESKPRINQRKNDGQMSDNGQTLDGQIGQTLDGQMSDNGQTLDGQMSDNGQSNIENVSLGKNGIGYGKVDTEQRTADAEKILDGHWSDIGQQNDGLSKVRLGINNTNSNNSSNSINSNKDLVAEEEFVPDHFQDLQKKPEKAYQENIGILTPHIAERIQYLLEDGISEELLTQYILVSVNRGKGSWSYIEKMATENIKKNITTLEQYNALCVEWEKKKSITKGVKKPQYANFDQREYLEDEYDKYYANLQDDVINKQ